MQEFASTGSPSPEELLSAAFDGEHEGEVEIAPDRRGQLIDEWSVVKSLLRSLPAQDADLLAGVRAEISSVDGVRPATRPTAGLAAGRAWIAVIVSVAAVLLLVLLPGGDDSAANLEQIDSVAARLIGQANPASWNVVVVTIDRDEVLQEAMQAFFGDAIGQIAPLQKKSDSAAEFSAGMLLAPGAVRQSKLESLIASGSNEWNPSRIGRHSREELKERFLASLQVPSHSDRVFGAMYVVGEQDLVVSLERLVSDEPDTDDSAIAMNRTGPASQVNADAPEPSAAGKSRTANPPPVLVIFRSRLDTSPRIPDQGAYRLRLTEPSV